MSYDFTSASFRERVNDISQRLNQAQYTGISITESFKNLRSQFVSGIEELGINSGKIVLIKDQDIEKLAGDLTLPIEKLFNSQEIVQFKLIELNENLEIIKAENTQLPDKSDDARKIMEGMATDGYVVFYLSKAKLVPYFINGQQFGEGLFYSDEDLRRYEERKPFDEIDSVFEEYRTHLSLRDTYEKFFVTKDHVKLIFRSIDNPAESEKSFINRHQQLLRNKPEDIFREDMRLFLQRKLKDVTLPKEVYLRNERRLDIAIYNFTGTELSFIEVKWVGMSVNSKNEKEPTIYDENHVCPAALNQTLDYIRELSDSKEYGNVKIGYLAVFDARTGHNRDTGFEMSETKATEENRRYFKQFVKLNDFKVVNSIPRT